MPDDLQVSTRPSCWTSAASPRSTTRGGERLGVAVSPCCRRRARVADRGGGGGDLAELHEVAVVADLVGAELVVAELHEMAVARQAGADARLEVVAARAELLDVGRVAQEHDTRR
jgi:hypothetical protein